MRQSLAVNGAGNGYGAIPGIHDPPPVTLEAVIGRLDEIEDLLIQIVGRKISKEWYTTMEVAEFLGKRPFTVREYCRLGRIHAVKRESGRGCSSEWMISHDELERIRNHGLLPAPQVYRHQR